MPPPAACQRLTTETPTLRLATPDDLRRLGDLSWRLQTLDTEHYDVAARDRYVETFAGAIGDETGNCDLHHWLAEIAGEVVAAMSVRIVKQLPTPGQLDGRWGYLTNVYALPDYRNQGIGAALFATVKAWAKQQNCAVLLVWPSERSIPFYEREGFGPSGAPLMLDLRDRAPAN